LKGWLLDTNIIAEVSGAKPDSRVLKWISLQDEAVLFLSILTLAEYDKGIHHLPETDLRRPRLEADILALEARFKGRILPLTHAIVRRWGRTSGEIKRVTGDSPNVIDTLLACTAIENKLYFVTRNTQDVLHSGAVLFNPWKDDISAYPLDF
jgi:predicted nucleic acid-binding protein